MFKFKNLFLIFAVAIIAVACKYIPTGPSIDPGGVVEFKYHRVRPVINPSAPVDLTGKGGVAIWNDEFGGRNTTDFVSIDQNTWIAETSLAGSLQRYFAFVGDYAVCPPDSPAAVAVEISARVKGNAQWILLDIIEPNRKMNGEWAPFRFQNGVLYPSSN